MPGEHDCHEVGQQLSDLQKRFDNLEGVVETQGQQIKEHHQKGKWPLRLRKQPSTDKGGECAQAIQEKETQIREKDSEIRQRDERIRYYQRKLDNAEALDEQSAKLAAELSEKENKLQQVTRQLLDLQQLMESVMAKNALMKKQMADDKTKHEEEIKKLKAKFKAQAHSDTAVEIVVVGDEDSDQKVPTVKEELTRLRGCITTLKADLEKSVTHSKHQSREIFDLKQQIRIKEVRFFLTCTCTCTCTCTIINVTALHKKGPMGGARYIRLRWAYIQGSNTVHCQAHRTVQICTCSA